QIGAELGRNDLRLAPTTEQLLRNASWPGNIRELRNALERAAILADDGLLQPQHFALAASSEAAFPVAPEQNASLAEAERRAIEAALSFTKGNRKEAAKRLGIGLRTLYDKIKRYNLP